MDLLADAQPPKSHRQKLYDALQGVENNLSALGVWLAGIFFSRIVLFLLALSSEIGNVVCLLKFKHLSFNIRFMITLIGVIYGVCIFLAFAAIPEINIGRMQGFTARFRTIYMILRSAICIGLVVCFCFLSKWVETVEGWNGYGIAFYLLGYLHLLAWLKLFRHHDFFGSLDAIMAVAMTIAVGIPKKMGWWQWILVSVVAFVLVLFKSSEPVPHVPLVGALDPAVPHVPLVGAPDPAAPVGGGEIEMV